MHLEASLEASVAVAATLQTIELIVVNESRSMVKAGGKWAVKDEDTETVAEAVFPRLAPGQARREFVSLPCGAEWGIFRSEAEEWVSVHGGNNTVSFTLTLGDA